ncbi:MAG TPA: glycoside hydrolase family 95 protein [Pyrinomonadaceae bacterium]|nr:glycoside hydrolase family 95 protein [Pyrinomonadaceae bacterium]
MLRRFGIQIGLILVAAATLALAAKATDSDLKLTYDKPATKWTEALPLGNGRIGAMVFGGIEDERVQINESTLWGGGPHNYTNTDAYSHLDEIRKLTFAGNIAEAEKLSEGLMGEPKLLMPYQPFCDMRLHFPAHGQATEYWRDLDLENAIATTSYKVGSVSFRREVFVSYPDQVLIIRITSSKPRQLTFSVGMDSPQTGTHVEPIARDTLQLTGQIQPRQNPSSSWTGSWNQPGMRFHALLKVFAEGGGVRGDGGRLAISNANSVTILFSNATSFKNYRDISGNALAVARANLENASKQSYDSLRRRHLNDFRQLFSRVRLTLGERQSTETTDRRIKKFAENEDPNLLALYFEFGRYLLISCSRPGGQPANLQGIWNEDRLPAWSSKMTTNINLQMNYWQADVGDLWETQEPLWSLIRDLRVTGAETAHVQYHSKGWVLHHNTDIWRATTPVDGAWGVWPMGGVWLANQMFDHYEFSGDRDFLRREAYPAMKEAAEFALGLLVEATVGTVVAGQLVTNPSTSPENRYVLDGQAQTLTYAPTMDLELIRELFKNCRRAAEVLAIDAKFCSELERAEKRMPPLQVGKRGQLQEWIEDYEEVEPQHRHISHLYSLFPGHDISLKTTPELAAAAKKSLELRGDGGTGWSTVWRIALWARLQNPEHAYNNLKILINTSTLPNMFDLCPPFQIDGNLGGPAAISEMLVQSTPDEITVLPALPFQWPSGSLRGVRVRGGGKVDITWQAGKLTALRLRSDREMKYRVAYGNNTVDVQVRRDKPITLDGRLRAINQ